MSQSARITATETGEKLINDVADLLSQHGYRVCVKENEVFVAVTSSRNNGNQDSNRLSDSPVSQMLITPFHNEEALSHCGCNQTKDKQGKSDRVAINRASLTCKLDGKEIELTTAEFELLSFLLHEAGTVVSRSQLFQQLLGLKYDGLDRSIDLRIARLRRKLNDDPKRPQLIKSVRGVGYMLVAPG